MNRPKHIRRLSKQESYKLINWLQEHSTDTGEGPVLESSLRKYAELAAEELGFTITISQVRGVCKDFGILCKHRKHPRTESDSTEERLSGVEGQGRNLEVRVLKIESFLTEQWGKDFAAFRLD